MKAASLECRKATDHPLSKTLPVQLSFQTFHSLVSLYGLIRPRAHYVDKAGLTLGVILLPLPPKRWDKYVPPSPAATKVYQTRECSRRFPEALLSVLSVKHTKKKGDQKYVKPICDLKGRLSFTLQRTSHAVMFTNKMLDGRVEITLPNHAASAPWSGLSSFLSLCEDRREHYFHEDSLRGAGAHTVPQSGRLEERVLWNTKPCVHDVVSLTQQHLLPYPKLTTPSRYHSLFLKQ